MRTETSVCRVSVFAYLLGMALIAVAAAEDRTGLDAIMVPEGFTVELAAGPPLVERPMLVSFDDRGRMYVCDSSSTLR